MPCRGAARHTMRCDFARSADHVLCALRRSRPRIAPAARRKSTGGARRSRLDRPGHCSALPRGDAEPPANVGDDAQPALKKILRSSRPRGQDRAALQVASKQAGHLDLAGHRAVARRQGRGRGHVAGHGQGHRSHRRDRVQGRREGRCCGRQGNARRSDPLLQRRGLSARAKAPDRRSDVRPLGRRRHRGRGRSAIDASKGDALADANNLRDVRAKVAQDRVGLFYVDAQGLVEAVAQRASSPSRPAVAGGVGRRHQGARRIAAGAAEPARVDAVSIGTPASVPRARADVLATLPADSWAGPRARRHRPDARPCPADDRGRGWSQRARRQRRAAPVPAADGPRPAGRPLVDGRCRRLRRRHRDHPCAARS